VVADGVLIRPVQPRLSLAERLASYTPMAGEATAVFHRIPDQASFTSASTAAISPSLR
jgi:antitoxin MazE